MQRFSASKALLFGFFSETSIKLDCQLTREVSVSFTNTGIMATPVVSSFIKHCCAIPLVVFDHPLSTQLLHEAKEVVFGFVFFICLFSMLIKVELAKCLTLLVLETIYSLIKQNEQ